MPLDDTLTRTAAALRRNSFDPETMTVEVVAATATPVARRDAAGPFFESLDMGTLDLNARDLPVLDNHKGGGTRAVVGIVQSLRVEGANLIATLRLSGADDAAPIVQRVAEGTVTGVSVGYAVVAWSETRDAQGTRVTRPAAWSLREISLTPTPADPNARIRSSQKDTLMEQETVTAPDEAESARRAEIRTLCRSAGMTTEAADDLIDTGATVDQAEAAAFDRMATRSAPVIRMATPANDDPAVIARRRTDALASRMGSGECPADARGYLGESALDMARSCLADRGVSTRGLLGDDVIARSVAHGTSDFPMVVSNAMGKVALDAFRAAESPLKMLCRQRTLPNFKPSQSVRLGGMGRLEEIAESGEITHTSRAETGETMRLKTYARGITVSRNLLIDDDLGLLGDMTAAFGQAAAQTEADLLVDLLTGNPDLSDGTPVFDGTRGNLAATGVDLGSAGAITALSDARLSMRQVKDHDGKTLISVMPRYLLVGPESETDAEKILAAIAPGTTDDVNPWAGRLRLLVEPRITDDRWYVFADPATRPTMVYGYLAAAQGVQIQRAEAWDTLGFKYRAFLDFGAGWTDWRGAYLNEGAA